MKTPYHTGKVAIGSAYVPAARPHYDKDALRLQDALLGNKPSADTGGVVIAAACLAFIAVVLLHHFIG